MTPKDRIDGCLGSPDDVLVHGANGVCGTPSTLPQGPPVATVGLALVAASAFGVLLRGARTRRPVAVASLAALVAGSAGGYVAVATRRADAPPRIAELATGAAASAAAMQRLASATTGCVRLSGSSRPGSEALLHYASPNASICGRGLAKLGAAPLGGRGAPCPPGVHCEVASDAPSGP